jgi:hypothetical protein
MFFIFPFPKLGPYRYLATVPSRLQNFTMGGRNFDSIDTTDLTIQKALDIARNSEEPIDEIVLEFLEGQLREIWDHIEAEPESYILNKDEFALFNFYRHRAPSSVLAQSAVRRFWDSYSGQQQ